MNYADLAPGYQFPERSLTMDESTVDRYCRAVGDDTLTQTEPRLTPPMALGALALWAVLEHLGLPQGAVHAGQELAFLKAVPVGEEVTYKASVSQNYIRKNWRWLAIELAATNGQGDAVMTGKSTVLFPAGEERG